MVYICRSKNNLLLHKNRILKLEMGGYPSRMCLFNTQVLLQSSGARRSKCGFCNTSVIINQIITDHGLLLITTVSPPLPEKKKTYRINTDKVVINNNLASAMICLIKYHSFVCHRINIPVVLASCKKIRDRILLCSFYGLLLRVLFR